MSQTGDVTPETEPEPMPDDPTQLYPDATPEAPLGYLDSGAPRQRARRGSVSGAAPKAKAKRPTSKPSAASESLARQATALLVQTNNLAAFGVAAVGFTDTAGAIAAGTSADFESMIHGAMLADPALAKRIVGVGGTSGKVSLFLAYGMLAAGVVPVAMLEYRGKREARATATAEEESRAYSVS